MPIYNEDQLHVQKKEVEELMAVCDEKRRRALNYIDELAVLNRSLYDRKREIDITIETMTQLDSRPPVIDAAHQLLRGDIFPDTAELSDERLAELRKKLEGN